MTWFKTDDKFHSHPKVCGVSLAAIGLWSKAGSWCSDHLTDGAVTRGAVVSLGGTPDLASELVEAGLWEVADKGWQFHDWLDHQPPSEVVVAKREAAKERMRRVRSQDVRANTPRTKIEHSKSSLNPEPEPEPVPREKRALAEAAPTPQHQLRIGFTQRLETEASTHPNQKALGQAIQQLVPWVEKTAPLRKLSEAELITRLLNGFFANENARTKGFPPAFLAQNPTEYLDTKPQLRAAARVPDGIPPIKHYGPREETG